MQVIVLNESGRNEALLGLSLSYNCDLSKIAKVAHDLAIKDGGHNKFLESIAVWIQIKAKRGWWQEFDTYRVGMTKQSESTMHTLMKRPLTQDNFGFPIEKDHLERLENLRINGDFERLKWELPEGFLQTRIVCTNYKTLRNIISQRRNHKLVDWEIFILAITSQVKQPEYFRDLV
jgi:hypothetical protein